MTAANNFSLKKQPRTASFGTAASNFVDKKLSLGGTIAYITKLSFRNLSQVHGAHIEWNCNSVLSQQSYRLQQRVNGKVICVNYSHANRFLKYY